MEIQKNQFIESVTIEAVINRGDGTVENLGVIGEYKKKKTLAQRLTHFVLLPFGFFFKIKGKL